MVNYKLKPNLYRTLTVILSDGSTFRMPSAVRMVGNALQLERDTANHPVYQASGGQSRLLDKRETTRLERLLARERKKGLSTTTLEDIQA